MGIIEDIEALELSDEQKAPLLASARADQAEREERERTLRRNARRTEVEANDVATLTSMFSDKDGNVVPEAIGLIKYARRVFLSDDEEPGVVLLTDDELELSDDQRTGSRQREEKSTAQVLREFIGLFPKTENGRIQLSDLVPENTGDDRPDNGNVEDPAEKSKAASERLSRHTGRKVERTGKRYAGAYGGGS